ncbi:MAG: pentapeptide repeat-containing protein [Planctomycetota bacterium]|nr:pentapeptide repeat-containing protein [Planctomycetota bacterium]
MHRITMTITLLLAVSCADAAWYQKLDGTQETISFAIPPEESYTGPNIEPGVTVPAGSYLRFGILTNGAFNGASFAGVNLAGALLGGSDATGADFSGADMWGVEMSTAVFTNANLSDTDLHESYITEADFSGADISGTDFDGITLYVGSVWTGASYNYRNEPIWASWQDSAWQTSNGIVVRTPEPSAILLALVGLTLVPNRRRRQSIEPSLR